MLTRLKVKGFKNLIDTDLYFGPFTCIAGPNGAGKSNLFDAISFISHLADKSFVDAARSVRGGDDVSALFSNPENGLIELRAEMLIPNSGIDDFSQKSEASATFVYYELTLALERTKDPFGTSRIRLEKEELNYIPKGDAPRRLPFKHSDKWLSSAVKASARRTTFIQTDETQRVKVVRLQSDRMQDQSKNRRGGGGSTGFPAKSLPRTVLSSAQNADETRTAVIVRQEMRSWRQLQLEPSALRAVDDFDSPPQLDSAGRHIPAVLTRLARRAGATDAESADNSPINSVDKNHPADEDFTDDVNTRLANSLVSLVEDVRAVRVDRDEARRVLRFMMRDKNDLELPASSLSDGTMRFVALSVIELDPQESGLICLEEPENGIHPQRVNAMLELLYRISTDAEHPIGPDNPLRQVIISTHSPGVVKFLDSDDVLFAVSSSSRVGDKKIRSVSFPGLPGSWRARISGRSIPDGIAISYLKGLPPTSQEKENENSIASRYSRQLSFGFTNELENN